MGHTGVSQKLDSESIWFNPAAASHQESKFHISAGATGIASFATYSTLNDYTNPVESYDSDNGISTPIYLYANYKITEDLSFGLSFNTPYGSSMTWDDNWAGNHLIQNISLTSYTVQPTVSYKFLNDKLSLGAGLMISWGDFELSRAMPTDADAYMSDNYSALGVTAHGASKIGVGVNVGILYDVTDQWSIGASYRSKINMKVDEGKIDLNYANETIESALLAAAPYLSYYETNTFSAELPLPATFSVGATFCPTERWKLAAELQFVQWSAYENLTLAANDPTYSSLNVESVKNYSNTTMARFGAEFNANEWLTGRLGFYVDGSPVASDYFNPETPSMTKLGYTAGCSLRPTASRNFSIDLAYGYITTADPERTGAYPVDNGDGTYSQFIGNYSVYAHTFSIGASIAF